MSLAGLRGVRLLVAGAAGDEEKARDEKAQDETLHSVTPKRISSQEMHARCQAAHSGGIPKKAFGNAGPLRVKARTGLSIYLPPLKTLEQAVPIALAGVSIAFPTTPSIALTSFVKSSAKMSVGREPQKVAQL